MTPLLKPQMTTMPLAEGLSAGGRGALWQEKSDGCWQVGGLAMAGCLFNAERMRDGSFVVNDLVAVNGEDVRNLPTLERWSAAQDAARSFPRHVRLSRVGAGGEFLRGILADGGEGCVLKPVDAPFGCCWRKCKQIETHDLVVVGKREASGVLELATIEGEPRGCCPARAAFDSIALGDVVEIGAQCITAAGRLREPRFIRLRPDKTIPWLRRARVQVSCFATGASASALRT